MFSQKRAQSEERRQVHSRKGAEDDLPKLSHTKQTDHDLCIYFEVDIYIDHSDNVLIYVLLYRSSRLYYRGSFFGHFHGKACKS